MVYPPEYQTLSDKLLAADPHKPVPMSEEEMAIFRDASFRDYHAARARELSAPHEPDGALDRDDMRELFRSVMQFARHLARKYGFTIRQWPEN